MKISKKKAVPLLVLALALCFIFENSLYAETSSDKAADRIINLEPNSGEDFEWKINEDFTEITITKYKGTRKDVVIPATIQDVPVVCIGKDAFYGNNSVISVIIPEGVKKIERYAFCRTKLKSVTLPADICLEEKAFYDCSALKTVILGENSIIGENAFRNCYSLQSIEIPKGCTLKSSVFTMELSWNSKLETVTLPEGLVIIPDYFFFGCRKLANINFPSTLKYIGYNAFYDCALTSVNLPEGLEYIEAGAFDANTITSVSLPKSLKWIECNGSMTIIRGNNINTITIAEGCSPKVINSEECMDGRDIIKGASIDNSVKLQKQLAEWKLTSAQKQDVNALYEDLLSYGIGDE